MVHGFISYYGIGDSAIIHNIYIPNRIIPGIYKSIKEGSHLNRLIMRRSLKKTPSKKIPKRSKPKDFPLPDRPRGLTYATKNSIPLKGYGGGKPSKKRMRMAQFRHARWLRKNARKLGVL